ncbi:MOSC domain-containing protein [Metabacillus fastidiosus]|uniref:MOSC domain-containing protein n=1 Tax=Metabacillus fastidiosus TaxID=1458 RepID=UPI002DB880B7|nr:MOSC domain-containing protein [Metabacillus fastidiosus]MEC2075558.1 MOSC domain-containing protein [Metabacillus fastidiosus]
MGEVISINIGKPVKVEYKGKELETGIYKSQVKEPIYLSKLNFIGDGQADLVHHGGIDKAVCVYPYEHYTYWEKNLKRKLVFGAFGENITVKGMTEADVSIGDIFKIGEAVVQITQPRQPCFKLAKRYDLADLPLKFQNTGYTGYYFKVLEEGLVQPDSMLDLIERDSRNVTIQFANEIMHHDKKNLEAIEKILTVDALSGSWRNTFTKRLHGKKENTKERLEGKR